jgi:hypothetical protein
LCSCFVGRVFFLDLGGVEQDDSSDLGGGRRAEDLPSEAFLDQFGQQAAVVQVSVGQQHRIDACRRHVEGVPVTGRKLALLIQTTIDQKSCPINLQQMSGTRHERPLNRNLAWYAASTLCCLLYVGILRN